MPSTAIGARWAKTTGDQEGRGRRRVQNDAS
jgi:hypothetical protein